MGPNAIAKLRSVPRASDRSFARDEAVFRVASA
jgi:hypothetical protein